MGKDDVLVDLVLDLDTSGRTAGELNLRTY